MTCGCVVPQKNIIIKIFHNPQKIKKIVCPCHNEIGKEGFLKYITFVCAHCNKRIKTTTKYIAMIVRWKHGAK